MLFLLSNLTIFPLKFFSESRKAAAVAAGAGAAVGTAAGAAAVAGSEAVGTAALNAIGFTSVGVLQGSLAAGVQSAVSYAK